MTTIEPIAAAAASLSASQALGALLGAGVGLGLTLLAAGLSPVHDEAPRPGSSNRTRRRPRSGDGHAGGLTGVGAGSSSRTWWRAAVAAVAGVLAGWGTGWLVVAVLVAAGAWWLPGLLGPDRAHQVAIEKIEAVAGWTEQLRDTLAAASGLEQAITTTARTAPTAVRPAVAALAARLRAGERLTVALAHTARELADPTADLVIAALTMAAQQQSRQLVDLLAALAAAAREEAAGRMRTAVARARVRTSVRVIVGATLGLATVLAVFNRAYLAPYSSSEGEIVLAGIGALFTVSFAWLSRIARPPNPGRLLSEDLEVPR